MTGHSGAEEDIYGDLDECHNNSNNDCTVAPSSDDEEHAEEAGELLLFSYFCDHFA